MAGIEYFVETTVQPRDHIPVNTTRESHTFAALIRLSTTTHNLLTFNISEISSNKTPKVVSVGCVGLWKHNGVLSRSIEQTKTKHPLALSRVEPRKGGGGALGYFLGGHVPPGTPNWHPVLKKISPKIDTPF